MSFYERAERAQKIKEDSTKIIVYPNRESEIDKHLFIDFSEYISQEIQNNLERAIRDNSFSYNRGMFKRKIDCRYETAMRIAFEYGKMNFMHSENAFSKGNGIVIYQINHLNDNYDPNCYNINTCYLNDTGDILLYILQTLKKDFSNIFMDASYNTIRSDINDLVDGLRMTRSLIYSTVDKVTSKVMKKAKDEYGKRILQANFQITVEIPCDKNGNIYL